MSAGDPMLFFHDISTEVSETPEDVPDSFGGGAAF